MNESFDKDFSNHTPMMQQYLSNQPNTMKKNTVNTISFSLVYVWDIFSGL